MPKRTDIESVLILGAGPIVIGQGCEFDYSGAQACKALKEEGYRVILVNSNPATIMTDPSLADATYIEPIHWEIVEKIIEKEREIITEEFKNSGKDHKIIDKIAAGKLNKFISDNTLLNQEWIMEPKKKVKDIIKEIETKGKIVVKKFVRFKVGEGV